MKHEQVVYRWIMQKSNANQWNFYLNVKGKGLALKYCVVRVEAGDFTWHTWRPGHGWVIENKNNIPPKVIQLSLGVYP